MNKKQTILKTAARLFAAQGFDGTTTLQISREAGVTEPLIYYHFNGKDDLFTRIIESTARSIFPASIPSSKTQTPRSDRSGG
jgi:AcrR family transcriptional regulator